MESNSCTLRVRMPNGHSLGLALLLFTFYLGATEIMARSEFMGDFLSTSVLGNVHNDADRQWIRFNHFASTHDSIDCIFLGDSTILTGLDPDIFEQVYFEQTGEEIECFNLGIGGATAASSAFLAKILVREFKPRLLVFGIRALSFTTPPESPGSAAILESPWLQYKNSQFEPEGWLIDHSYLYRYRNFLIKLIRLGIDLSDLEQATKDSPTNGFLPLEGPGPFDMSKPPDPNSDHPYDEHYFAELGQFKMLPSNLAALDQISKLDGKSTMVLAVEMPVSDTFFYYFNDGEQDYSAFIYNEIERRLAVSSIPFWETSYLDDFPQNVWFNRNHLNKDGAEIFSEWFGKQVGGAVQEGTIPLPSSS